MATCKYGAERPLQMPVKLLDQREPQVVLVTLAVKVLLDLLATLVQLGRRVYLVSLALWAVVDRWVTLAALVLLGRLD